MKQLLYIFGIVALLTASCVLQSPTTLGSIGPSAATTPPVLQNVGFEPPLNGQMPLGLHFRDETGRDV